MPKYRIKYVYENWYNIDIEADSIEDARNKFDAADFNELPLLVGGELQDSVLIEEVHNG